jgi:hypothetical protein
LNELRSLVRLLRPRDIFPCVEDQKFAYLDLKSCFGDSCDLTDCTYLRNSRYSGEDAEKALDTILSESWAYDNISDTEDSNEVDDRDSGDERVAETRVLSITRIEAAVDLDSIRNFSPNDSESDAANSTASCQVGPFLSFPPATESKHESQVFNVDDGARTARSRPETLAGATNRPSSQFDKASRADELDKAGRPGPTKTDQEIYADLDDAEYTSTTDE